MPEDLLIFCHQFHQDGVLTANELDLLTTEFNKVNQELPSSDLLIVLHGKPELAWKRIQQRGRKMEVDGGWKFSEIRSLNRLYKTYAEDVEKCGFHKNPSINIDINKLNLTNRVHMGYIFEKVYQAFTQTA